MSDDPNNEVVERRKTLLTSEIDKMRAQMNNVANIFQQNEAILLSSADLGAQFAVMYEDAPDYYNLFQRV